MNIEQSSRSNTHPDTAKDSRFHRKSSRWIFLVVIAALFGFAGGIISPFALQMYQEKGLSGTADPKAGVTKGKTDIIAEDQAIIDLVEQNSKGVVSIIITKDVPRVRSFFDSPFPFFFDPFGGAQPDRPNQQRQTQRQQVGSGSGFFVSRDGLILTNKHVVSDPRAEYTIITNDGKEYPARVLAQDPNNDIAVMKVEGNDFPALSLGDSNAIRVGQTVIAIGNPLGEFANSVTRGIISGLQRNVLARAEFGEEEQLTDIIQTDAAINPGNSGGPLFNISGQVIGVNVAVAQGAENIGFALPINPVKRIVEEVRTTGKISTPYLGIRYIMLNETLKEENNLPFDYGALVLRGENMTDFAVLPGSPADKAGIMENDIILEINGTKVDENHPLANLIASHKVGEEIVLKVWHKGDTKDIKVKLEERQ